MPWLLAFVRRLLSKEQRRFIKFCLVGASGVPVNLLATWGAYHSIFFACGDALRKGGASLFGIAISIFTNFLLNDMWTWRDRSKTAGSPLGRLLRFYVVSAVAAGVQFATAMALTLGLHWHYLIAQVCGIAVAMAINFVINNVWTFRATPAASPPCVQPPREEPLAPERAQNE